MQVFYNHSLKPYNTFGLSQSAEAFVNAANDDEILEALEFSRQKPLFIIGGGSNILLTKDIPGITLHVNNKGLAILPSGGEEEIRVKVGAGEVWHDFVMFCVERSFAGVENLSLIPGSVGAGPMQNIGAYGAELEQVFHSLDAIHRVTLEKRVFYPEECAFGYRTSIFKTRERDQYIITSVTFSLSAVPKLNTSYGAINRELEKMGVTDPTIRDVSDAVIRIRRSKLPDPAEIGNAGSFFKNPVVPNEMYASLKNTYPELVAYPAEEGMKLAAGWLIEKAGWKGFREGDIGVHQHQALVLVNYGNGNGESIYRLSEKIILDIDTKFGVKLEREVNLV